MSTVSVEPKGLSNSLSIAPVATQFAFVHWQANPFGPQLMPRAMTMMAVDDSSKFVDLDRNLNSVHRDIRLETGKLFGS